MVTSKKNLVT